MNHKKELLLKAINASIAGGKEIIKIYQSADPEIDYKADNSPLTIADKNAHKIIVKEFENTELPLLSEEGKAISWEERKHWPLFWLVDPLDGTKEFIKKNGEFTVNIALISNKQAVAGVIYVPVIEDLYFGILGSGAWKKEKVSVNDCFSMSFDELCNQSIKLPHEHKDRPFTICASRSHLDDKTKGFVEEKKLKYPDLNFLSRGSSLKLCMIAEGLADIYPRFAPTYEWDTAAGNAIVSASGGKVLREDMPAIDLSYNKENLLNPFFFAIKKQL